MLGPSFFLLFFLFLLRWSTVLDVADTDATGSAGERDVAHDRSSEAVDVVIGLVECISLIGTDLVELLDVGTFGEMSVPGSLDDVGRERIVSGRSGDDEITLCEQWVDNRVRDGARRRVQRELQVSRQSPDGYLGKVVATTQTVDSDPVNLEVHCVDLVTCL